MRILIVFLLSVICFSCSFFEPSRADVIDDLTQLFNENVSGFERLKSYLIIEKNSRNTPVQLVIAERAESIRFYEKRLIDGKKEGFILMNSVESSVSEKFFVFFNSTNIGKAYTYEENKLAIRLLDSPLHNYNIYYVWSANGLGDDAYDWSSNIENNWYLCGKMTP
jgi:hypothetical protein